METVVLIPCSKKKSSFALPARFFYRSHLFVSAVIYAERSGFRWVVLSALQGVVEPNTVIKPYNFCFASNGGRSKEIYAGCNADKKYIEDWNKRVNTQLRQMFPSAHFVFFGPRAYAGALDGLDAEQPLDGLGIGERLQWFKSRL